MPKLKIGSKSGLRYFTMQDLRSFGPCYDPKRYLSEDFKGTALTILDNDKIPPQDRLWVVLRTSVVSEKLLRLFAVWCARHALTLVGNPDPRSLKACDVAEQFARGKATAEQLSAAREGAWAARREKYVYDAAYAAYAAAYAYDAAYADAAAYAAYAAADAAYAAADAADAARNKARREQVAKLRQMVVAEGKRRAAKRARLKSKRRSLRSRQSAA